MNITTEETEQVTICHLQGNLEYLTVEHFRSVVAQLKPRRGVVFDLGGVAFMDSAGIGALIGSVRRAREMGAEAAVAAARPSVSRVLNLVGLPRVVDVTGTVDEAVDRVLGAPVA